MMTGVLIAELDYHTSTITCLVAGRNVGELVSAGLDGFALLWDATDIEYASNRLEAECAQATDLVKRSFRGHRSGITHCVVRGGEKCRVRGERLVS